MTKPCIVILATGGTIAGRAASEEATTGYAAGALPVEELLAAVPELSQHADIRGETVSAVDSKDMTEDIWRKLAARVKELAADDRVDGIVITHGTDTMEETAFYLALTTRTAKPVVLTGAMRPATALSADGPMNLLDAVKTAADPAAKGRDVLVVMNDEIFDAATVTKGDTIALSTFRSPLGPVGRIEGGRVHFYRGVEGGLPYFDVPGEPLPKVYILYGHAGADGSLIRGAVSLGAAGLVYAGTGNGSIHKEDEAALAEAAGKGIPVVRASRAAGPVISAEASYEAHHFIPAGLLNPQKARILLALTLAEKREAAEVFREAASGLG